MRRSARRGQHPGPRPTVGRRRRSRGEPREAERPEAIVERSGSTSAERRIAGDERARIRTKLLKALELRLPTPLTPLSYRLAIVGTTLAMLTLPVAYAGFVALLARAAWWLTVYAAYGGTKLAYVAAATVVVVAVFLLKPLFRRPTATERPRRLKREKQPLLFDYVEAVCVAVGAPKPAEIAINLEVQASAGAAGGFRGLFTGDLCLTIGLPLLIGLNLREFTGVLAHEFAHFSQKQGLRFRALLAQLTRFFLVTALERDEWDATIAQWTSEVPLYFKPFFWFLSLLLGIARGYMLALSLLARVVGAHTDRQLEFHADRRACELVGSGGVESLIRKLPRLVVAHQAALADAASASRQGQLADDFPKLLIGNLPQIPQEVLDELEESLRETPTHWADSHPSGRDRIAATQRWSLEGLLNLYETDAAAPASILMDHFGRVSRALTQFLYLDLFGRQIEAEELSPANEIVEEERRRTDARSALLRYFQSPPPLLRPLRLDDDVVFPPDDVRVAVRALKAARKEMVPLAKSYGRLCEALAGAESSWRLASEALMLSRCSVRFRPGDYRLRSRQPEDIRRRVNETDAAIDRIVRQMLPFEAAAERRLSLALRLLEVPEIVAKLDEGSRLRAETQRLLGPAREASNLVASVPELICSTRELVALLPHFKRGATMMVVHTLELRMRDTHEELLRLHDLLKRIAYPFVSSSDIRTFADFVLPAVPDEDDFLGCLLATQHMGERLGEVQLRIFAQLAFTAEKIEHAVGLKPLSMPKPATPSHALSSAGDGR